MTPLQSVAGRMEMTHELKTCPFCGLPPKIFTRNVHENGERKLYWYVCNTYECGVSVTHGEWSEQAAREKWNKRADSDAFAAGERKGKEQSDREAMTLDRVNYLCEKWERKGRIAGLREAANMATENAAARNINWVALDIATKANTLEREAKEKV